MLATQATRCALHIQLHHGVFNSGIGFTLHCHAAVTAGDATGFVLGLRFVCFEGGKRKEKEMKKKRKKRGEEKEKERKKKTKTKNGKIGGVNGSWEYIVVGDPVAQLATAVSHSNVFIFSLSLFLLKIDLFFTFTFSHNPFLFFFLFPSSLSLSQHHSQEKSVSQMSVGN